MAVLATEKALTRFPSGSKRSLHRAKEKGKEEEKKANVLISNDLFMNEI